MTERLQTVFLLTGLAALAAGVGLLFAGTSGLTVALLGVGALWFVAPQVPNAWVLRAVNARPLRRVEAPDVVDMLHGLAHRAGLPRSPALFVTLDRKPQAFTIGEAHDAAIVLSAGMMRTLDLRELRGVLAHEVTHVAHGDIRLLRFASTLSHVTTALSRAAALVALIGLPLILAGFVWFSPLTLLAMVVAPWIAQALLLALSRTREHAADAGAAALTGDPAGLASALARLEARNNGFWHRFFGVKPQAAPEWLQTHPPTEARIRRLMGDASSRKPQGDVRRQIPGHRPGLRRARIVVRRGPRTTILRAV